MKLTGYYTTAGEKIAAGLLAGATLSVTRITAGSGSTALSAAALDQEQQNLGPCEPEVSGTTAVMRCTLSSDQAKAPYFLRELGVYAMDDTQKEVLYLIFRLDEQVSINPAFRLVLRFNLEQTLSDGAGVKVTAPLTGLATQEELKTKADLAGGQVPYQQMPHLTESKTLYVDAALGDNANPGTQDKPFKTIQAAVDSLPKDLGRYSVTINVAEGVYDDTLSIIGFTGGMSYRPLTIKGSDRMDESRQVGCIIIANNASLIRLDGLFVSKSSESSAASLGISNSGCYIHNVKVKSADKKTIGVSVGANAPAQVYIANSEIDGYTSAGVTVSYASLLSVYNFTIKNCGTGLSVTSGISMGRTITYENNSSNTAVIGAGQIFGGE